MDLSTPTKAAALFKPMQEGITRFRTWYQHLRPAREFLAEAQAIKVTSAQTQAEARRKVLQLKAEKKDRCDHFKADLKDHVNAVRQMILDQEKLDTADLDTAITLLDDRDRTYERAEQARVEAVRREAEEKERRAKEAEREREAKAIAAEAKKKTGPEKQELLREAEMVRTTPVTVTPASTYIAPRTASVAGLTRKKNWKSRVDDVAALWKAVLAGKVNRRAFEPSTSYLDGQAKLLEEQMNAADPVTGDYPFPGVVAINDDKLAGVGGARRVAS